MRALWPMRPEEERQALLERWHEADRRDSGLTREVAEQRGEMWTADDEGYLLEHRSMPAREVALALERTLWAVRNRRSKLLRSLACLRPLRPSPSARMPVAMRLCYAQRTMAGDKPGSEEERKRRLSAFRAAQQRTYPPLDATREKIEA
jgi:hypothetical protein